MKVLLYLEGKSVLEKSGIGRALQHQMHALDLAGIPYTTDVLGDYDSLGGFCINYKEEIMDNFYIIKLKKGEKC